MLDRGKSETLKTPQLHDLQQLFSVSPVIWLRIAKYNSQNVMLRNSVSPKMNPHNYDRYSPAGGHDFDMHLLKEIRTWSFFPGVILMNMES